VPDEDHQAGDAAQPVERRYMVFARLTHVIAARSPAWPLRAQPLMPGQTGRGFGILPASAMLEPAAIVVLAG
jgi:hypothetical protein